MKPRIRSALSLLAPLLITLVASYYIFAWIAFPLFGSNNIATKIASSAHLAPTHIPTSPEFMEEGDHLQLMYHFWLLGDYLTGGTPFLHNVYELNFGDDNERKMLNTHHFPFPLVFTAISAFGSRALAWNLTCFMAIWLTWWFTWLLARRYLRDDWLCALASLIVIVIPYRYTSLLEGSPEGFAMMWTPLAWLGLEMLFRENRPIGGFWTGLAILMASFCDSHVFLFTLYYLPVMLTLAWLNRNTNLPENAPTPSTSRRVLGLALAASGFGLSMAYALYKKAKYKGMSHAGGRRFVEIEQYSLDYTAFRTLSPKLFLSAFLLGLIALGLLITLCRLRKIPVPRLIAIALLTVGFVATITLAMGVRAPLGLRGTFYRLAYEYLPMYDRIRQPAKIFCYMPLVMAMLALLSFEQLRNILKRPILTRCLAAIIVALIARENASRIFIKLCTVATEQQAYQAVVDDARQREAATPRSVILPIFQAIEAQGSVYLHYASLYRLRMVNGYYPVLPKNYPERIAPLLPFNHGHFPDAALDSLLERGIDYLILHQDMYADPSADIYPANRILHALLNHPRIVLLKQDREIASFRILPQPQPNPETHFASWQTFLPRPAFNPEKGFTRQAPILSGDHRAIDRAFLHLYKPGRHTRSHQHFDLTNLPPGQHLKLRLNGQGRARVDFLDTSLPDKPSVFSAELTVDDPNWRWYKIDLSAYQYPGPVRLKVSCIEGIINFDYIKWGGLHGDTLQPGESLTIPASALNHQAHIDIATGDVVYHPEIDPYGDSLQTPHIALAPGFYEAEMTYTSDAKPETNLFNLFVVNQEDRLLMNAVCLQGQPAIDTFTVSQNKPIQLKIHFTRLHQVRFHQLTIRFLHALKPEEINP